MICRRAVSLKYDDWLRLLGQSDDYASWREFFALWLGYSSTAQLTGVDAMQCETDYHKSDRDTYSIVFEVV